MDRLNERHEADLGLDEWRGDAAEDARRGRGVHRRHGAAAGRAVQLRHIDAGDGGGEGAESVEAAEARGLCGAEAARDLRQEVLAVTEGDKVKEVGEGLRVGRRRGAAGEDERGRALHRGGCALGGVKVSGLCVVGAVGRGSVFGCSCCSFHVIGVATGALPPPAGGADGESKQHAAGGGGDFVTHMSGMETALMAGVNYLRLGRLG